MPSGALKRLELGMSGNIAVRLIAACAYGTPETGCRFIADRRH